MRSGVNCGRKSTNVSGGFRTSNERYVWVRWTSPDAGGARSWELNLTKTRDDRHHQRGARNLAMRDTDCCLLGSRNHRHTPSR